MFRFLLDYFKIKNINLHKIRKGSGLDLRTISQQITFTQEQMRILNYWTASQVKKNRYRYLSL